MTNTATPVRDIETTKLPNGVRVITEVMPHVRSISVGIWIGTGSRRETADQNGVSHFIEHMLFKGTTSRSAEDIARSVDSIGGNLDAFTAKELVCFNTKVLDQHLPLAFDVLADLVLHPLFREEDIAKEKGVILEEIKMEADSPDYLVHEIFSSNFWKDHPLGKPILGTRETVKRFDHQMIGDYYKAVYSPSNILITAAGNLTHQALVQPQEGQGRHSFSTRRATCPPTSTSWRGRPRHQSAVEQQAQLRRQGGGHRPHARSGLLQITAPTSTVTLAHSRRTGRGQKVYAIGNPFGLAGTMTRGIISSIWLIRKRGWRAIEAPSDQ